MSDSPEQRIYGPVEPRPLDVLEAEQATAGELLDAVQQEKNEFSSLPTAEQAKMAGHVAMLDEDASVATKLQEDIHAEATVRSDIDRNRRQARLEEMRAEREARRELDKTDPLVQDPQTGQPVRQSVIKEENRNGVGESSRRY